MNETLYRKYRPKNFSEIIGQHHIVQTLSNSITHQRIGQAYLFTGPRGTGKTSIARIFAKAVNCTDLKPARNASHSDAGGGSIGCEKCQSCKLIGDSRSLDIIEIDAASNTGVDNIRELRETISLPPTSLKYKVYIIDEVHMLSTGAFNALLKTLEEPPAHVIFILATTQIHKVPETIISRCQRFDFARLPISNIIEKLSLIAKSEKISIDKDSLEMIAISAGGGMRDAESLLAQIMALEDKKITLKEVREILGTTDRKFSHEIAELIFKNDSRGAIDKINGILNDGYDLQVFNKSLINYLRQLMLLKISPELKSTFAYEITSEEITKMQQQIQSVDLLKIMVAINLFLDAQNKIAAFMLPQLPLEIAVIKATHTFPKENANYETQEKLVEKNMRETEKSAEIKKDESKEVFKEKVTEVERKSPVDIDIVKSNWNRLLEEVQPYNHSLKALLSNCKIMEIKNNELTLATAYDFYKEKLNEHSNRLTIEKILASIVGSKISIKAVVDKNIRLQNTASKIAEEKNPGSQDSLIGSALKIMGGKIVKE